MSILCTIRRSPGLSRAEVAKHCDLAKSTVSSIVDELVRTSILEEAGSKTSTGGRRPVGLIFNPKARVSIGLSLENDRIEFAISDLDGNLEKTRQKKISRNAKIHTLYSLLLSELELLMHSAKVETSSIAGLGIAVPGPVSSVAQSMVNGLPLDLNLLRQQITNKFHLNCRVIIDSNTNMAAIAECRLGAAKNSDEALVVRLGSEIRSALIKNRKLIRGTQGLAGALGHLIFPGARTKCYCGKQGCINTLAAPDFIVAKCQSRGANVQSIDEVIASAESGDKHCHHSLTEAAEAIGYGVASAINLVAPHDVIITGRLVLAGDLLVSPLKRALEEYCCSANLNNCNLVFSEAASYTESIGASLAPLNQDNFMTRLVTNNVELDSELESEVDLDELEQASA